MLRINLASKKFSQMELKFESKLAKIKFTNKTKDIKNIIYFASEGEINEINSQNTKNQLTRKLIKNSAIAECPIFKNDIEKNKFAMIYPFTNNNNNNNNSSISPLFSERLIYTESPIDKNFEHTKKIAAKALRALSFYKLETLHVIFSENFPLENRKIAINSLIMANYNYKLIGENKNKNKKNKILKEIKIVNDNLIKKNFKDFLIFASLANANLFTRELANMRPNFSNCDYLEEIAKNIFMEFKENQNIKNKKINLDSNLEIEIFKGNDLLKNN